jgi:periplasmic divalent cation tolerance protein
MADLVLVLTTMPNDERAEELALTLINERLAACVNVHSAMTSAYRWNGAVEHEVERQLVIKTTRDRLPALESRLRTLHPYELAEFVVIDVAGGSAEYLRWVGEETRSEGR